MSVVSLHSCVIQLHFPLLALKKTLPLPSLSFLSEYQPPEICIELNCNEKEDVEPKITTLCGLEEIGASTKHSILSCLHSLFEEDARKEEELVKVWKKRNFQKQNVGMVAMGLWEKYTSQWSANSIRSLTMDPLDTNILSISTGISAKNDNFAIPYKPILDDSTSLPTLAILLANPIKLAETFALITLFHPNYLKNLKFIHSIEKKYAKNMDFLWASMDKAILQLKDQQSNEMEVASKSFSNSNDMKEMSDLVFLHEQQKITLEVSWRKEINSLKAKQKRLYIEFLFNFYQQQIMPSILIIPRSFYARLQASYAPWSHPKRPYIASLPTPSLSSVSGNISQNLTSVAPAVESTWKENKSSNILSQIASSAPKTDPVKTFLSPNLAELLSTVIYIGGQSKTEFKMSLFVGDLVDFISCDYSDNASNIPNDNDLIVSRSSILHALYSEKSLSAIVIPHASLSILDVAPLPVDIPHDIDKPSIWTTGGASQRTRSIVNAIDHYSDYHFATLSEQLLAICNDIHHPTKLNSNTNDSFKRTSENSKSFSVVQQVIGDLLHNVYLKVRTEEINYRDEWDVVFKKEQVPQTLSESSFVNLRIEKDWDTVSSGDFLVTRHSNLRNAHILFHLLGCKDSGKSEGDQNAFEGLKQVIITADQTGVSSLTIPILLSGSYIASKHTVPTAIQRELDQIFRCIRTGLYAIANRRALMKESRYSALVEIKLVLPLRSNNSGNSSQPNSDLLQSNLVKQAKYTFNESFGSS